MSRPDLAATFTKITLWSLTEYRRIVYLDADTLPLRSLDSLFTLPSTTSSTPTSASDSTTSLLSISSDNSTNHESPRPYFAAAPEAGWPDAFNSGFLVLSPSSSVYSDLLAMAKGAESFDGGDQGLLNMYFGIDGRRRLSFCYNVTTFKTYRLYVAALGYWRDEIKVLHFTGREKPWGEQRQAKIRKRPQNGAEKAGKGKIKGEAQVVAEKENGEVTKEAQGPAEVYGDFYSWAVQQWWDVHDQFVVEGSRR
jgi:glycogenin glucosyltransferase